MRISFQNPTQGPLITVSFENNDGPLLAFVPAAVDCGAKATAVTGAVGTSLAGPLIIAAITPGDSSPKAVPMGINRFAPRASTSVATTPVADPAVDLPASPSSETVTAASDAIPIPTGDNLQFLNDLQTQVEKSLILTPAQKVEMRRLIERALRGDVSIFEVAKMAWRVMMDDMLAKLRAAGIDVQLIETPDGVMYEMTHDRRKNSDLLSSIFTNVNALLKTTGDSRLLTPTDDKYVFVMRLPSWDYMFNVYGGWLKNIQFVARNFSSDDIYAYHVRGLALVQIALTDKKYFIQHGFEDVHGLIFLAHDIYHAIHWNRIPEDVKAMVLEVYPLIKSQVTDVYWTRLYDDLLELFVDADHSDLSIGSMVAMAMVKLAAVAERVFDSAILPEYRISGPERHAEILMALRALLLRYDQSAFSDQHRGRTHDMADRVERRCTGQPCTPMIFTTGLN